MNSKPRGTPSTNPAPIAIGRFLARLAEDGSDLIEAWVRVAAIDAQDHPGQGTSYELADPELGRRGGALHATLASDVLARLSLKFDTVLPWDEVVGSELVVKLRTKGRPGRPALTEIVGFEEAWVERQTETVMRHHIRTLAADDRSERQRLLPEPAVVATISVLRPEIEPLWPSFASTLQQLAEMGAAYEDVPRELRGPLGWINVDSHLEKILRGKVPSPDILLVMASRDRGLGFREQLDTAALACDLPCPLVVGFGRGRYGSLLHEVAFAARETPSAALETVKRMVLAARGANVAGERLRAHHASRDARERTRRR